MVETAEDSAFFNVDLRPAGYGIRTFGTAQHLVDWLERERDFWSFLGQQSDLSDSSYPGSELVLQREVFTSALNSARLALAGTTAGKPAAKVEEDLAQVRKYLRQGIVAQRSVFLSDDPRAALVKRVWHDESPTQAAHIHAAFHRQSLDANNPAALEGAFRAFAFKQGIAESEAATRDSLDRLRRDYQSRLDETKAQEDALRQRIAETTSAVQSAEDLHRRETDRFRQNAHEAFASYQERWDETLREKIADVTKDFGALEETLRQRFILKAPYDTWAKKAESHDSRSRIYAIVTVGFALVYFGAYFRWLPRFSDFLDVMHGGKPVHPSITITVLIGVAVLGVWALRVFVRLLLSNLHLAADCRHRSTLVEPYLALLQVEGGHAIGELDRPIVLEQIFRPATDGVVRDDAMPGGATELVSRIVSGQR